MVVSWRDSKITLLCFANVECQEVEDRPPPNRLTCIDAAAVPVHLKPLAMLMRPGERTQQARMCMVPRLVRVPI